MAYGGDHRDLGAVDGPSHALLVKGPQVLHGAAPPAGDDQVGGLMEVGPVQGGGDLLRRPLPLHPHRQDAHLGQGVSGPQDAQHVPHRRPCRRGDQGDAPGIGGQRPFVGLVEQALPQQLLLQLLKGYVQVPRSLRGQADAVQLILPVPWEHGDPPGGDDLHPVLRAEAQGGGVPPEHDAPQCPLAVLQRKIVVPGGIHLIVGQLPPHQQAGEEPVPVHPALDIAAYLGGTEDGLFSHASSPPSRARRVRMATPMALSVE